MATILCLDDFTCGLADAAQVLRENGYDVLTVDNNVTALELAYERRLDAVLLNCQHDKDNSRLVTAFPILQPQAAVVMFSGYCGVPCRQLHLANVCVQKSETSDKLLPALQSVICQSRFGFCRSVAA